MSNNTFTLDKKAQRLIATFSKRELSCYEYIIDLLTSDLDSFAEIETATKAGDSPALIQRGYVKVMHGNFRALYILATLGLHASMDTKIISVI